MTLTCVFGYSYSVSMCRHQSRLNMFSETLNVWASVAITSYSMVVLYIRDHGGLGFSAQQYRPKSSLTFPTQQFGSIG